MSVLLISALSIGFIHTLLGPDHYVPFVVLAKSRHWSMMRTTVITLFCGIGHVLSAVVLGVIPMSLGFALNKIKVFESFRGEVAAWLLIGLGFAYFIWGMRNAIKNKKHLHFHLHSDGSMHVHEHDHTSEHAHPHPKKSFKELTPWLLFIIFIFGPCEALIPLIMYPAIQKSIMNIIWVTAVFGFATLSTMLMMVLVPVYTTKKLPTFAFFERYGNAMAGM
ncbi:MAG: sulfite exporter TauE/SafE family protein, partial [Gammaproteobacteria bacterium]|nr:sulfite exporter TauE/SafE family protein [Gammaproteobacteria bacterium]